MNYDNHKIKNLNAHENERRTEAKIVRHKTKVTDNEEEKSIMNNKQKSK